MPFAGLFSRLRGSYTHMRLAILVTLLFTVLVATIFRTPAIIFMASLLFAAPLMGILAGGFFSRGIGVSRAVPEIGSVGDIISGRLALFNRAPWPVFLVHLRPGGTSDDIPKSDGKIDDGKIDDDKIDDATLEANASWANGSQPIALLSQDEAIVPLLQAGERLEWAPQWRLQRRGVHRLPAARAGANDPLGLFSALAARSDSPEITVLPRPVRVERLSFLGGAQANPRTPQHAAVVAEALDFHGVRVWRPGEAIRRVHWKSTARTGTLHVVEWEESLGRDLTLLLDMRSFEALRAVEENAAGRTARNKSKSGAALPDESLEAAITLVASVAAHLLEGGHRFQMFCWQNADSVAAGSTSSNLRTARDSRKHSDLPDGASSNGAPSKDDAGVPLLCRHQARGAGDINDTLKLLARLEALPNSVSTRRATLAHLAAQAAPQMGRGDSVLLVASTMSDIEPALVALSSQSSGSTATQAQILALDTASFHEPRGAATPSPLASSPSSIASGAMRVVRRGDSLAAALERD